MAVASSWSAVISRSWRIVQKTNAENAAEKKMATQVKYATGSTVCVCKATGPSAFGRLPGICDTAMATPTKAANHPRLRGRVVCSKSILSTSASLELEQWSEAHQCARTIVVEEMVQGDPA